MNTNDASVLLFGGLPSMSLLEAATAYLNSLSVDVDADQLVSGLPIQEGELPKELLSRAVGRLGYHAIHFESQALPSKDLPCCAALKSGCTC
jgi:hypothetical protein